MRAILVNQVKGHFAHFVECHQYWMTGSLSTQRFWATDRQQQSVMPLDVPGRTRATLSAAGSRLGFPPAGKLDRAKALTVWALHWIRLPERVLFRAIRTVRRHGLGPLDVLPERSNRYLKEQKSWPLDLGNKEASSSLPLINWNNP